MVVNPGLNHKLLTAVRNVDVFRDCEITLPGREVSIPGPLKLNVGESEQIITTVFDVIKQAGGKIIFPQTDLIDPGTIVWLQAAIRKDGVVVLSRIAGDPHYHVDVLESKK